MKERKVTKWLRIQNMQLKCVIMLGQHLLLTSTFVSVQGAEKNSTSLNTKQRLHTFSRDFIFCPCWCQIQVMSKDLPQYFCIKAVFSRDDSPLSMSRPKLGMQVRYFNHNLSEESSRAHLTLCCVVTPWVATSRSPAAAPQIIK